MTIKGYLTNEPGLENMPVELINNGKQIFFGNRSQLSDSLLNMESCNFTLKIDRIVFDVTKL